MNLKNLAKELGLSVTTVSRALNGFPEVSARTRELVRAAAARHHYRPDASARRLALGRTDAVGLVLPTRDWGLEDTSLFDVIAATNETLAAQGVDLLLLLGSEGEPLSAYHRALAARRVDAFVVVRTRVRDERLALLRQCEVPFVAYGRSAMLRPPYAWLDFDHEAGAVQAARRLLALGHRRVGYIGAPPWHDFAPRRFSALAHTLLEGGATLAPGAVWRDADEPGAGHAAMRRLLALPNPPPAVFVDNGQAAFGAVRALREADLQPGSEPALLVYGGAAKGAGDGAVLGHVLHPQPAFTGRLLAELTLALLAGKPVHSLQCLRTPVLCACHGNGPVPAAAACA